MASKLDSLNQAFQKRFRRTPLLVQAPGRINLIGEHTDYNQGLVMPGAIDRYMYFAISPSGTERCNIFSQDLEEGVTFSIYDLSPGETWVNYLMGVMDGLERRGILTGGVDCIFGGNIPTGAGLSSSAALCCGFGFALNEIFNGRLDRKALAKIAQYSEHEFAEVNCGLMDQYASLFGKTGHVLSLDCQNLHYEHIPFHFPDIQILLIDTKVKHALASTDYNYRRAACEEGVSVISRHHPQVYSLRDASRDMLEKEKAFLSEDTYTKCRFVLKEMERTKKAIELLKANDLEGFGSLLYETHWGLSQEFEVSCKESDELVALASKHPEWVYGARQMGGGFGGCTLNLVKKEALGKFTAKVKTKYLKTFKTEPDFYLVNLSDGVRTETPA